MQLCLQCMRHCLLLVHVDHCYSICCKSLAARLWERGAFEQCRLTPCSCARAAGMMQRRSPCRDCPEMARLHLRCAAHCALLSYACCTGSRVSGSDSMQRRVVMRKAGLEKATRMQTVWQLFLRTVCSIIGLQDDGSKTWTQ